MKLEKVDVDLQAFLELANELRDLAVTRIKQMMEKEESSDVNRFIAFTYVMQGAFYSLMEKSHEVSLGESKIPFTDHMKKSYRAVFDDTKSEFDEKLIEIRDDAH